MRAAVTQQPRGEKIAMTAPVTQQAENGGWTVRFVMPARYTLDTLPEPNNPAVGLKHVEATRVRGDPLFRSRAGRQPAAPRATSRGVPQGKGFRPLSPPAFAFYNPPWTLPFLRRNEVMIEIARG